LHSLYFYGSWISELSGDVFTGISTSVGDNSIDLERNPLHDLSDEVITKWGNKLKLNYSNCFSTTDSSANTINLVEGKNSNWKNNQYLCIKDVTYDPQVSPTAYVTATVNFYGNQNRLSNISGREKVFTANGTGSINIVDNNNNIAGPTSIETLIDRIDDADPDGTNMRWRWSASAGNQKNFYFQKPSGTEDLKVDCGDGSPEQSIGSTYASVYCTYANAGTYEVRISNPDVLTHINLSYGYITEFW
jgi:hypothetical protein